MANSSGARRIVEINQGVFKPVPPRPRALHVRRLGDYPGVARPHLEVAAKLSRTLMTGPPICDELIAFIQHAFTEEEASVVRHLGQFSGSTAADVARAEHRPLEQIEPILRRLAMEKRLIGAGGAQGARKYRLMPIMPGMFEMALISETPQTMSAWHRRFAELFEALYETGYIGDFKQGHAGPSPFVRVIPVGSSIEGHPMALPSDRLEVILDRYKTFAVGQCQCRLTMEVAGRGCGKPLGNCTVMGQWAQAGIAQGWARPVSRSELLDIKRHAESHGLVTWTMNVESSKGQASCSCCGCCCHAMRMVNEFNTPGVMAPAHFLPVFDSQKCSWCGRCARACPMGALTIDTRGHTRQHLRQRCIGCGLCKVACGEHGAMTMEPVPAYPLPYKSWFAFQFHSTASMLKNAWTAWRRR